ncbi:MAG: endonuclease/exonuclease/phosphatase family protein [Isosphaeraceae bacterium]|nr:endonuclease/exonuclease/phosphatase family protein [Isosphaeraceae bacterium]
MNNNRFGLFLIMVALIVAAIWLIRSDQAPGPLPPRPTAPRVAGEGYVFCTWNVENLFDDTNDPHNHDEDEDWFAAHPEMVHEKVRLLADTLVRQNDGRGPDILAVVEVENRRAIELLRAALNARLPSEWRYEGLAHVDNVTGRRIEPAIVTRLALDDDQTRAFGIRRILEAHLEAEGAPLVVLASHWTSRLRGDTEGKRDSYADVLYDRVVELSRDDPAADVLLSGDFNDEPDDPSLRRHLHTTGDPAEVREGAQPVKLLDLTQRLDPAREGTYFQAGRWEILDHIVASPGLLDPKGWMVLPETIHTENPIELRFGRDRRPWRFGNPKNSNPRGPSDHFGLTVRMKVGP